MVRRWVIRITGALVVLWIVAVVAVLSFRHDLIYPFRDWPDARQVSGVPGAEARTFRGEGRIPVTYWYVAPRPGKPVILYFMGNAGSLPSAGPRLEELALAGFGIAALNYRGAGGAVGDPRQDWLTADGVKLFDLVTTPSNPPVVYGTSLGAAVAVQVAARRPASALILETPFARFCEVAQHHQPWLPACLLMWDERWESTDAIGAHAGPLLVLHGDADRIIPISQGEKLFAQAREPKRFVSYPGGRHNDLRLHGAGREVIGFLEELGY